MDSRMDWFHGFKKKVLEGHRAMVPLEDGDEDAPYPSPRPITGLPEPIPGESFWEKSYSESASEFCSDVEYLNESESSFRSEESRENIPTTPEPESKLHHYSGTSLVGGEEDVQAHKDQPDSVIIADLRLEVQDLNKYIDRLHSDNDDCKNTIMILQDTVERTDAELDFYIKLYESTKYKGGNGTVQPIKSEKRVRYRHGKRIQDDAPLFVDPLVKALVDKRLERITQPSPNDLNLENGDKQEMCKEMDKTEGCSTMDKAEEGDNTIGKNMIDSSNDNVQTPRIIGRKEENTTCGTTDNYSELSMYSSYMDGYSTCKILKPDSHKKEITVYKTKVPEEAKIKTVSDLVQGNGGFSDGSICSSLDAGHSPRGRSVLSNDSKITIEKETTGSGRSCINEKRGAVVENGGNERNTDEDVGRHVNPKTPPVHDVERILAEIEKIDYLIENREEDASSVLGKYTIHDNLRTESYSYQESLGKYQKLPSIGRARENLRTEESFCHQNTLGKYQKLPAIENSRFIPSSYLHIKNQTTKTGMSSSDQSIINDNASTKINPKFTKSNTINDNVPNVSIPEKKNQARVSTKLLQKTHTNNKEKNSTCTLPKKKLSPGKNNSVLPEIKLPSGSINSNLPTIKSENSNLPKIKSGNSNTAKFKSGNSNLPTIKSGNSTLPKIKSITAGDNSKRNNLVNKIKTPVLPNLMKSIPTLSTINQAKLPSIKQTKRPYIGKYKKLPPILDLNTELEKHTNFKDT